MSGSADADDGGREREEAMQHLLLFLFRRFASTFSQCCLGSNVWLRPAQILRGKRPPFPFSAFMWSASEPDFMSHDLTPFSPHGSVSRYFATGGELLVYRMCWSGRLFRADEYSHVGAYVASLLCRFFDTLGVFPLSCLIDACDACLSIGVYRERVTSQRERYFSSNQRSCSRLSSARSHFCSSTPAGTDRRL